MNSNKPGGFNIKRITHYTQPAINKTSLCSSKIKANNHNNNIHSNNASINNISYKVSVSNSKPNEDLNLNTNSLNTTNMNNTYNNTISNNIPTITKVYSRIDLIESNSHDNNHQYTQNNKDLHEEYYDNSRISFKNTNDDNYRNFNINNNLITRSNNSNNTGYYQNNMNTNSSNNNKISYEYNNYSPYFNTLNNNILNSHNSNINTDTNDNNCIINDSSEPSQSINSKKNALNNASIIEVNNNYNVLKQKFSPEKKIDIETELQSLSNLREQKEKEFNMYLFLKQQLRNNSHNNNKNNPEYSITSNSRRTSNYNPRELTHLSTNNNNDNNNNLSENIHQIESDISSNYNYNKVNQYSDFSNNTMKYTHSNISNLSNNDKKIHVSNKQRNFNDNLYQDLIESNNSNSIKNNNGKKFNFSFNKESLEKLKESQKRDDYIKINNDNIEREDKENIIGTIQTNQTADFKQTMLNDLNKQQQMKAILKSTNEENDESDNNNSIQRERVVFIENKDNDITDIQIKVIRNDDDFKNKILEVTTRLILKEYFSIFKSNTIDIEDKFLDSNKEYYQKKFDFYIKLYNFSLFKRTTLNTKLNKIIDTSNLEKALDYNSQVRRKNIFLLLQNNISLLYRKAEELKERVKANYYWSVFDKFKKNANYNKIIYYSDYKYKTKIIIGLKNLLKEKKILFQKSYLLNKLFKIRTAIKRLRLSPLISNNKRNSVLLVNEFLRNNNNRKIFEVLVKNLRMSQMLLKNNYFNKKRNNYKEANYQGNNKFSAINPSCNNKIIGNSKKNTKDKDNNQDNEILFVTVEKKISVYNCKDGVKKVVRNEVSINN